LTTLLAERAMKNFEARNQIAEFNFQMCWFALLAAIWFGSGLFADDRRLGAHQLYFARPLTRLDYFLGKFLTVAYFSALAVLGPGLVICTVAAFASPNWSFVRDAWGVILDTFAHAALWVTVTSCVTLCVSSLVSRKAFALAGAFGFFMLTSAFAALLGDVVDRKYHVLSPLADLGTITGKLFKVGYHGPR